MATSQYKALDLTSALEPIHWTRVLAPNVSERRGCGAQFSPKGRRPTAETERSIPGSELGWVTGFEPATSGTTIRRSNQLSYTHRILRRFAALVRQKGFEPLAYCLEGSCSILLSYWRVRANIPHVAVGLDIVRIFPAFVKRV